MIHPDTELRLVNEIIGYGVFATRFIPQGTITWVVDELDRKIDEAYVLSLDRLQQNHIFKYSFRDRNGDYILCWDIGRYVNHSFRANCISTAYDFEIAVRDIYPGEELTDDYACFNLDEPFECLPEPGFAKTKVMPDDFLLLYPEWDKKVANAMNYFNRVEQPLKKFISSKVIDKVNAVAAGDEQLDSMLNCYYDRQQKLAIA
ncbi:SET domain-containing protein-lysine N-methyltransferase [cyanobacterium TDX16]|nr:SET domain-containing protein-lysine N-methyltransferase [cyanobacterium TDX16]